MLRALSQYRFAMEFLLLATVVLTTAALAAWRLRAGAPAAGGQAGSADAEVEHSHHFPLAGEDEYTLFGSQEQVLYERLQEALPDMRIFAQVGIAQLAQRRGREEAAQLRAMAGRGVDFVICRRDCSIVAAVELCWSQPRPVAGQPIGAEEYKRQALARLGIPLVVFRPNRLPDVATISREMAAVVAWRGSLESGRRRMSAG